MITFAHPAFLWALPSLMIPVILHLMQRQIPRRVVFPSIRFILKGRDLEHGRRGLRDLLTLLARLCLLALVIILFAEPGIPLMPLAGADKGAVEIVLLVDASCSMGAGDFQNFMKDTVTAVDREFPGAKWGLIVSADGVRKRIAVAMSPEELAVAVEQTQPFSVPGQHAAAVQVAGTLFSESGGRKICVVASDMQASDWGAVSFAVLQKQAEVRVLRPDWSTDNVGIMSVEHRIFESSKGRRLQAAIRIRNFALDDKQVRLRLQAGEAEQEKNVQLAGRGMETFVVELELQGAQEAVVELIDADAYGADNQYYLSLAPETPTNVAIIHADRSESQLEAFFLERALEARHAGHAAFQVKVASSVFFIQERLADYDCIYVLDALRKSSLFDVENLKNWVAQGGSLVYFSGRDASASIALMREGGLTEIQLATLRGNTQLSKTYAIQQINRAAPVLAPFIRETSDLTWFPIYRYADLMIGKKGEILLQLGNDAPFLIRETIGSGRVYTFAVGLVPGWSDFPTSQSFLPLVRRIAETSGKGSGRGRFGWVIGEKPAGVLEDVLGREVDSLIPKPGVQQIGGVPVEVNTSRRESDLRQLDEAELYAQLLSDSRGEGAGNRPVLGNVVSLSRWVATVLLIVALLEVILANYGAGRKPRKPAEEQGTLDKQAD